MPMKQLRKFGNWIGKQVDGFVGGLMRLASVPPSRWLPSGWWSFIVWLFKSLTWAFGTRSPYHQIPAAISLAIVFALSSTITFGATLALVGVMLVFVGIGFLRLIPAVNRQWVGARDMLIPEA